MNEEKTKISSFDLNEAFSSARHAIEQHGGTVIMPHIFVWGQSFNTSTIVENINALTKAIQEIGK